MASNLTAFYKTPTGDQPLDMVQTHLVTSLNPVFNMPLMGGNLLTNQTLTTGLNTINHGLGRTLNGWIIVRQRAQSQLWDSQNSNSTPTMTLALNASLPVTVDIYVF